MANFDFNLHKIFVEGATDQGLLQFILEEKYDAVFNDKEVNSAIIDCGGWNNLESKLQLFDKEDRVQNGGINFVVFDADGKSNNGGFGKRKAAISSVLKRMNVRSELFLFPDDESDGDLEDFYCSCFKEEMAFFNDCWDGMIGCFNVNKNDLDLKLPKAAGKVFSYVDLFEAYKTEEYKNSKSKRSYFDKGLWNFDFETNPMLIKLVAFLSKR